MSDETKSAEELTIEALEALADAEEAQAKAVALSPLEARKQAVFIRRAKAREDTAAANKARRNIDMQERLALQRAKGGKSVLFAGIDLFDLFPLGEAPDVSLMPGGGVIIARSPESLGGFHREVEHKKRDLWEIHADLCCSNTVDPPTAGPEGAKLRAFFDHFNGAALGAGDIVAKLGGSKAQADKRGRS